MPLHSREIFIISSVYCKGAYQLSATPIIFLDLFYHFNFALFLDILSNFN